MIGCSPTRRGLLAAGGLAVLTPAAAAQDLNEFLQARAGEADFDHGVWEDLLTEFTRDGRDGIVRVDYAGWKADGEASAALRGYIAALGAADIGALSEAEQYAFWVNAYNAVTVQVVLEVYPVSSIRRIKPHPFAIGPWGRPVFAIAGRTLSLDDIEHGILRRRWDEPRVHYAVNCASVGCPNLKRTPWTGAALEADLDAAARAYVNHPRGVSPGERGLRLSSIYDWYADDFGDGETGLRAHLAAHAALELARAISDAGRIAGYDYDWSLNE